jgi:hypothetical protein
MSTFQRVRGMLGPAVAGLGAVGGSYVASIIAPDKIKAWGEVLGVSPVIVLMGAMLWAFAWRGHNEVIHQMRELRHSIQQLTLAVVSTVHMPAKRPNEAGRE